MSFERECVRERAAGAPGEEGEASWSCIRAFFLLSWRAGPRTGEALQRLGVVLVRRGSAGRLRRLSQDGHVSIPTSRSAPSF